MGKKDGDEIIASSPGHTSQDTTHSRGWYSGMVRTVSKSPPNTDACSEMWSGMRGMIGQQSRHGRFRQDGSFPQTLVVSNKRSDDDNCRKQQPTACPNYRGQEAARCV